MVLLPIVENEFSQFCQAQGLTIDRGPVATHAIGSRPYPHLTFHVQETQGQLPTHQHALHLFFQSKFEALGFPLATFMGFVNSAVADAYVSCFGVFLDADITTLTHGKYTHALQFLLIQLAIEQGIIDVNGATLNSIAKLMVESEFRFHFDRQTHFSGWHAILDSNLQSPFQGPMQLNAWLSRQSNSLNFVAAWQNCFHKMLAKACTFYDIDSPLLCVSHMLRKVSGIDQPFYADRYVRPRVIEELQRNVILGGGIYIKNSEGRYCLFDPEKARASRLSESAQSASSLEATQPFEFD